MLGIISKKDNKNNNDDFQEENISSIKKPVPWKPV